MRSLEWQIAWRYLFSRERKALVSTITIISMTGIAIGVAALIVVIGVMDGATQFLFGRMASIYPSLVIRDASPERRPLHIDPALLKRLRNLPGVIVAEPMIQRQGIVQSKAGIESQKQGVPMLIGVDEITNHSLFPLKLKDGESIKLGPREIMLGLPIMKKLKAQPGGTVILNTFSLAQQNAQSTPRGIEMRVRDSFSTGLYAFFDSLSAFISNDEMRRLYGIPAGYADAICVKLKDPYQAEQLKKELNLDEKYSVSTWKQENGDFFSAIQIQKLMLFIILLIIILVAAFNIIGTLILMVTQKTREIGILRAVGASEGLSARIFLYEGALIGLMGTLLGVAIGLVLCALIPLIKLPMPPQVYNFDHLPVTVKPLSVLIIMLSSMLICLLASLFPARQAAKLNPVEALRYD